jgi:hypothetical protein
MGETRNIYNNLSGKPNGKRLLGTHRRSCEKYLSEELIIGCRDGN